MRCARPALLYGLAVLLAAAGSAAFGIQPDEWRTLLLDGSSVAGCRLAGSFRVQPDGGPDGGPAIVFEEPAKAAGSLEVDLPQLGVELASFDELQFDLYLDGGMVDVSATLWGYPDPLHRRRYFASKRFPKVGRWDRIRFDLDLDDDSSRKVSKAPERKLLLTFRRRPGGVRAKVRIANVRLVRRLIDTTLDPRRVRFTRADDVLVASHPVRLRNRTGTPLTVELDIVPETLNHFAVRGVDGKGTTVRLEPHGERTQTIDLSVSVATARSLPVGTVERARVAATVREAPGFRTGPLRGYRPVYLFGVVPPRPAAYAWLSRRQPALDLQKDAQGAPTRKRLAELEARLDWRLNAPLDVRPAYQDFFRCPACKFRLSQHDLFHAYCHNKKCPRHGKTIPLTKDHPLFAPALGLWHMGNAVLARDYARAWAATKDRRFGRKAVEILRTYAEVYQKLPVVGEHSTGAFCRLTSATLFEKHPLADFVQAYFLLKDSGLVTPDELRRIREDLLGEMLYSVNLHYYGMSSGQVGLDAATVLGALATDRWWFLADALAGDAGVKALLDRAFDADGIGIERGAYAGGAAERLLGLSRFLADIDIATNRERVAQIVRSSSALGLMPGEAVPESTVLEHTGFTVLVNGKGATWRKATINWGSSRERGEHDLLSVDLADRNGPLIQETGRIAYANPYAFLMYATLAHHVPVVDQQDIAARRARQEYFHSAAGHAACLIADDPAAPLYAGCRLQRALVLFDGCLLVVDRVTAEKDRTVDLMLYGGTTLATGPERTTPVGGPLGDTKPYQVLTDVQRSGPVDAATLAWQGNRPVVHLLGEGFSICTGKTRGGFLAEVRDFALVRRRGRRFELASLYSAPADGRRTVKRFVRLPCRGNGDGVACRVEFDDGTFVDIVISLDGRPVAGGSATADSRRRVAVSHR